MSQAPTTVGGGDTTRLFDAVEAVVPGVLHNVVEMVLWDAIEEFCIQSAYWRTTLEWTLPAGMRELDLNPVSGDAIAIQVLGVEGLTAWTVEPPAIIVDSGDAAKARTGWALVALKPPRLSTRLPAALTVLWFEALKDGVLGRLYSQPAKPYSSPQLAEFHSRRFKNWITRARDAAAKGNVRRATPWRFPYFAGGRRRY